MYSCPSLATKTRRPLLNCVLSTRSYHTADCNTDRSLVGSKVRLQLISTHRSKQKGRLQPAYSSTQLGQQSQTCASTSPTPFKSPSATAPHQVLKKMAPHPCRHLQLGHGQLWQEREVDPIAGWFEATIAELERAIAAKRAALLNYQREPSAFRKASNDAQRIANWLARDHWPNLCQSIQPSADCGNIRTMYDRLKIAFHPSTTHT